MILLVWAASGQGQTFQLAPPRIIASGVLFDRPIEVVLKFDLLGAVIYYTLDGSKPTPQTGMRYGGPFQLNNNVVLKAVARHPDFQESEVAEMQFINVQQAVRPQQVTLRHKPNSKYPGVGAISLFDKIKGGDTFQDSTWLGFAGDDLDALVYFKDSSQVQQLTVSSLSIPGSWIFPPRCISVEGSCDGVNFTPLAQQEVTPEGQSSGGALFYKLEWPRQYLKAMRVVVQNYGALPDPHPGRGAAAWLFVDELIVQ